MIFEIEVSVQAEIDLRSIYEYIVYELQSRENAVGQINRLEKGIKSLNHMPERYKGYEKEPWHSRRLRIMPLDNYCIFYIPNKKTKLVTILRIMYYARDLEAQLKKQIY